MDVDMKYKAVNAQPPDNEETKGLLEENGEVKAELE